MKRKSNEGEISQVRIYVVSSSLGGLPLRSPEQLICEEEKMKQENTEHAPPPAVRYKERAIELFKKYQNEDCLIFVREEDLNTPKMFYPVLVKINAVQDDFHNIQGNLMPKRHYTDRIGEAIGLTFLGYNCGTRTEKIDGNTVYVGFAQAEKLMPGGRMRRSSICEYEFNPTKRAEADILRDKAGKYKDENAKKLLLSDYEKYGRRRANTGARLAVIRELANIPISFTPKDIHRAMIFGRTELNMDEMAKDPEMKHFLVMIAAGKTVDIYGPPKQLEDGPKYEVLGNGSGEETGGEQAEELAEKKEEVVVPWDAEPKETEEEKQLREMIKDLRDRRKKYDANLPKDAKSIIDDILSQEEHDFKTISNLVERFDDFEKTAKEMGVTA